MPKDKPKYSEYYKEILLDRDYEYFMKNDIELGNYNQNDIDDIYVSYNKQKNEIHQKLKENKKQFLNYINGLIILMFDGGGLPALFRLDGITRQLNFTDFKAIGKDWAYFEVWKKYERRKKFRKNIWGLITKLGAVLAIILTIIKILELINILSFPS